MKDLKKAVLFIIGRSPPNLGLSVISAALRETFLYLARCARVAEDAKGFDSEKFATLVPIGKFTG